MTRLWLLTALLGLLALAGCGPDCDKFCSKLAACARQNSLAFDTAKCLVACDDSKGDKSHTIQCVIDNTCTEIPGRCSPTGSPP